ncbi:MAG: NADH-quinone oxidoreductase subunit B [Deltaproteobacteria bacterium]|nr:NADH-quinone oxidoreductase subunit B [Deltaproteobacteria bacterium]
MGLKIIDDFPGVAMKVPGGSVMLGVMDAVINWARANSLWPLSFGTSCCAIEMLMATGAPHQDMARFGAEVARPSPRQADLLVVAGTIVKRMAPTLRTLYEQMAEPRYVMATGACAISGGPFIYNNYSVVRGADEIIPVDVYVPGCPPRPEAFFYALLTLQRMIRSGDSLKSRHVHKRPVMSALPAGITVADIQEELRDLLERDSAVDVEKEAAAGPWAGKGYC